MIKVRHILVYLLGALAYQANAWSDRNSSSCSSNKTDEIRLKDGGYESCQSSHWYPIEMSPRRSSGMNHSHGDRLCISSLKGEHTTLRQKCTGTGRCYGVNVSVADVLARCMADASCHGLTAYKNSTGPLVMPFRNPKLLSGPPDNADNFHYIKRVLRCKNYSWEKYDITVNNTTTTAIGGSLPAGATNDRAFAAGDWYICKDDLWFGISMEFYPAGASNDDHQKMCGRDKEKYSSLCFTADKISGRVQRSQFLMDGAMKDKCLADSLCKAVSW
eukprot:409029_1